MTLLTFAINTERRIKAAVEQIEFMENTFKKFQSKLKSTWKKESSLTSIKSQRHSNFQEKQLKTQQNDGKLEDELSKCEKEYEAFTTKMQKDIEIKRTVLITSAEQCKVTMEEQINREL